MVTVHSILRQVPDTLKGKQGLEHPLSALLSLILLSIMNGRKGMKATFHLERSLSKKQLPALGFRPGCKSPCHAALTQLIRIPDPDAMARAFSLVSAKPDDETATDDSQIAVDGKTMRGRKDVEGRAEHVLSAFCARLEQPVGHASSRGK